MVREILAESADILEAPRMLLVWEEPGGESLNLACRTNDKVLWIHDPETSFRRKLKADHHYEKRRNPSGTILQISQHDVFDML